jgi:hypothetical protein
MTRIELRKQYKELTGKQPLYFDIVERNHKPTIGYCEYLEDLHIDKQNKFMDDGK